MKRLFSFLFVIVYFALSSNYAFCEETYQNKTLRIYGKGAAGDWHNPEYNAAFPSIQIDGSETLGVSTAADLITVLLTEEAYDIYIINYANSNFSSVMKKGYALDLSCSPQIATGLSMMYEFLFYALADDTFIYGIPVDITCQQWGVSMQAWAAINEASNIELPRNYDEFLDLFDWWIMYGQYEYPDICLVKNAVNLKKDMINYLTKQILDIAWSEQNADILLNPKILSIFQRIESMNFNAINPFILDDGGTEMQYVFDIACDWAALEEYADEPSFEPLVLEFSEDVHTKVPIDIRVMFINPSTLLKTESIAYVEYFIRNQSKLYNVLVFDLAHEPIENPYVSKRIIELKSILDDYLISQDGIYIDKINEMEKRIEYFEKMKWLVTKEKIEAYQEYKDLFFVRKYNPIYMNDKDNTGGVNRLIEYFSVEKITSQQFIDELYRQYNYAALEEQ